MVACTLVRSATHAPTDMHRHTLLLTELLVRVSQIFHIATLQVYYIIAIFHNRF